MSGSEQKSDSAPDLQAPELTGLKNEDNERPPNIRFMSSPVHQSPLRHHYKRTTNPRRQVKETLNARSEYSNSEEDGIGEHRINQYLLGQEIGRGSFGSVHLASDQFGREYAVKEFSKSRLRKRAQSNLLRKSKAAKAASAEQKGFGRQLGQQLQQKVRASFNLPMHHPTPASAEINSLDLIREEIAIMKKLDHPNVVSLIEVLDDPSEDSLYMVLEMCKKGVVMKVGLGERSEPYTTEQCRHWFRDMILGLEYLHAQGIVHRDIKPDNCLITQDDCLKIVDFGVSEMFSKDQPDMTTAKSAGSPAFMPPELCVVHHGKVSGRAADIWSMGVTLYCLAFGHIPFEETGMFEMFAAIRDNEMPLPDDCDPSLADILRKLLDKDPATRIKMDDIRIHPWVTNNGSDPLLAKEDNIMAIIEPPTEDEVNAAITAPMARMMTVMKAATKFKSLLQKNTSLLEGMFDKTPIVAPPTSIRYRTATRAHSDLANDRNALEGTLVAEGIHRDYTIKDDLTKAHKPSMDTDGLPQKIRVNKHSSWKSPGQSQKTNSIGAPERPGPIPTSPETHPQVDSTSPDASDTSLPNISKITSPSSGKGQAHDPLEDTLFLQIGTGSDCPPPPDHSMPIISESPGAVDINVYEQAYQDEIQKIIDARAAEPNPRRPTIYLTKRVEGNKYIREHQAITDWSRSASAAATATAYAAAEGAAWGINKLTEVAKSGLGLQQDTGMSQQVKGKIAASFVQTGAAQEQSKAKAKQIIDEIDAIRKEADHIRRTNKNAAQ